MKRLSFRAVRFSAGCVLVLVLLHLPTVLQAQGVPKFDLAAGPLELSGPANPWRFVNAVGEKAGIWGFESGVLEGWVYPLKVFHDFNLVFQVEGEPVLYPADQFTVTETLFTPRREPGFVVLLEARTSAALRVFVRFRPDLSLMWPGSLGGQAVTWNKEKGWMELSEPSGNFSALLGSP